MRTRISAVVVFFTAALLAAAPARAQYGARIGSDPATGETYHVEIGGYFWNPTPDLVIVSEGLGIPGNQIDFVTDLGIEKSRFRQLKVVVRPGTKHKLRFEYTPISYEAQQTVTRDLIFNGQRFRVGLPVTSDLEWKAFRFGYEWDFVYRDRGFVGLLLDVKYTDVQASLTATALGLTLSEFARARGPIPTIGIIGRGYVVPNISITAEFSGLKVPGIGEDERDPDEPKYKARYFDFDLYGTVNFTDNFGAQLGYRSFDVEYKVEEDEGDLVLKGLYFGGVVRF